jgi:nucleotide-binding universal stress UspA family protein
MYMQPSDPETPRRPEVIAGFDGGAESCDALALASRLAISIAGELIVASVYSEQARAAGESRQEFFRRSFDRAAYELDGLSFTRCELVDNPARGLHMLAEAAEAAALVVGSTRRGRFGQVYPGSVGEQLLQGATCPVGIAPRGFTEDPCLDTVGVGYEGPGESERALGYASRLAERLDANLTLLTVGPRYGPLDALFESTEAGRATLRRRVDHGLAEVPGSVRAEASVREGDAAAELVAESHSLDLLVLGSRGFGPVRSVLLGSVATGVVRSAECAVILVPRGFDPASVFTAPALEGARRIA